MEAIVETASQQEINGEEVSGPHCGKECLPMILVQREIHTIKDRLGRGDKSLDMLPTLLSEVRNLAAEVKTLGEGVGKTADVVTAWGNIQGFGKTMKGLSTVLKTSAVIVSAVGAIYFVFMHPEHAIEKLVQLLKAKE